MPSAEITKTVASVNFQDGRRRHVGNSSAFYKMGNYHPISMKIGTQTKKYILSSKVTKAEAYSKKTAKINVKNGIVLKRQRCMSAKL
jgi:hypothetical protein